MLSACTVFRKDVRVCRDFDAGGGTRTPDTRIMIPARFGLAIGQIALVGHGVGHTGTSAVGCALIVGSALTGMDAFR
jgi:hypothetical protein